jgi:hypothetical protein
MIAQSRPARDAIIGSRNHKIRRRWKVLFRNARGGGFSDSGYHAIECRFPGETEKLTAAQKKPAGPVGNELELISRANVSRSRRSARASIIVHAAAIETARIHIAAGVAAAIKKPTGIDV